MGKAHRARSSSPWTAKPSPATSPRPRPAHLKPSASPPRPAGPQQTGPRQSCPRAGQSPRRQAPKPQKRDAEGAPVPEKHLHLVVCELYGLCRCRGRRRPCVRLLNKGFFVPIAFSPVDLAHNSPAQESYAKRLQAVRPFGWIEHEHKNAAQ